MKISKRGAVEPAYLMEVLEAANKAEQSGRSIIHMEVGEPVTGVPKKAKEFAIKTLSDTHLGYTESLGLPGLRQKVAKLYSHRHQIELSPDRVVITTGSSGAFILSFLAAFDAGDRVVLSSPSYPAYRNILTAMDIEPIVLPSDLETQCQLSPKLLDSIDGQVDGVLVASPANPTGSMLSGAELQELINYCDAHQIRIISDEIYHGITYGKEAETALKYKDDVIVINGFSKYFCMTGWRLGWMVVPDDMLVNIKRLSQNLYISPPTISQHVAIEALDCEEELDKNVVRYAQNRDHLLDTLPNIGIAKFAPADGAFYLFADVSNLTNDSTAFCHRMLDEIGVATTPGIDFDPILGHRFLRFSYAGYNNEIIEATQRLREWLK